ncbi:MAG: terminase TerL endonuclease subunit [Thermodesulfobacteriota bacterium]
MKQSAKTKIKRKNKGGRPRRPDSELKLEGYQRIGKRIKKAKIFSPLKIPKFRLESQRVIYFFKNFLVHTMGEWANKPFNPLPWQVEFIQNIFDTKGEDKLRQYKKALLLIGRKNGKTLTSSGLLLYFLSVKSEEIPNLRIYSAAATKDQASLIYDAASQMIEASPELKKRLKPIPRYKRIINHKTGCKYEALSSEVSSQYGFFNSSFIIFDEMWLQKSIDFVSALMKSQGNLKEPLFLILSTAGNDRESPLFDYYTYGKQLEKKLFDDPSFYFKCYELDEGDDWRDESVWVKANPSIPFGVRKIEEMKAQLRMAVRIPREAQEFRQFYCNEWSNRAEGWVNISDYQKCYDAGFDFATLKGESCYCGIDLAKTIDFAAICLLFEMNGLSYIVPSFWLPEDTVKNAPEMEKVLYEAWAREGHLILTPGNTIDYEAIINHIRGLAKTFKIEGFGVDPYQSNHVTIQLQQEFGEKYFTVTQTYKELSAPTREAERLIVGHLLRHNGNRVMTWMIDNCSTSRDTTGNIKIDRRSRNSKVDGVSSLIDALWVKLRKPVQSSVYDDPNHSIFLDDRPSRQKLWDGLGVPPIQYVDDEPREPDLIRFPPPGGWVEVACPKCGKNFEPDDSDCARCGHYRDWKEDEDGKV